VGARHARASDAGRIEALIVTASVAASLTVETVGAGAGTARRPPLATFDGIHRDPDAARHRTDRGSAARAARSLPVPNKPWGARLGA
jgi:hypothetical protein